MLHGLYAKVFYCSTKAVLTVEGLLNKHSQIIRTIGKDRPCDNPHSYRFQIGEHVIRSTTWASVQLSATEEVLDIFMSLPPPPKLEIIPFDTGSQDSIEEDFEDRASVPRDADFAVLDPVPIVLPFLAWSSEDNPDGSCRFLVADRFLYMIYSSLMALCPESGPCRLDNLEIARSRNTSILNGRPKISIIGKTVHEVAEACEGRHPQVSLHCEMRRLLAYFVPDGHGDKSAPIQLYWGAAHELLVSAFSCGGTSMRETEC